MTDISSHSETQTAMCAGINEKLVPYHIVCKCTRKGYNTLKSEDGRVWIDQPDLEFYCTTAANENFDMKLTFNNPTMRENGDPFASDEIQYYQLRVIDTNGQPSDWVQVER